MAGRISPALATKRWSSKVIRMRSGGCVAASIGCSWFGLGFLFQNHYPRFTGSTLLPLQETPHTPSFRWIRAEEKLVYLDYGFHLDRMAGRGRASGEPFTFGYIGTHIPANGVDPSDTGFRPPVRRVQTAHLGTGQGRRNRWSQNAGSQPGR